jgi:predicted dienelactone hydrolase
MKKFLLVMLVLALLLLVSGAVLKNGKQAEVFPAGSQSEALLQPGPMQVLQQELVLVDERRATRANGDYAGDSKRRLEGMVWRPASTAGGPFPLVVYSHGFMSTWEGGAYLAQHLASLGYVVVSVNYPLTTFAAPGGPDPMDVVNQPADISFIIDSLVQRSTTAGDVLQGMVDEARIGVMGISLGGMTTTLVTFHPEMRDSRIGAALSIAGPTAIFKEQFFSYTQVPFMMLAGDIDAMVPYSSNAAPVIDKIPGSELVTLASGSHTGFSGPAAPLRWLNNPDSLGCYMVKSNVDESAEESWFELIGTPEQGIDYNAVNELCLADPLPEAMNVLRQQMISSVVVRSFFQSVFASDASERKSARAYLSGVLPRELTEVSYRSAR